MSDDQASKWVQRIGSYVYSIFLLIFLHYLQTTNAPKRRATAMFWHNNNTAETSNTTSTSTSLFIYLGSQHSYLCFFYTFSFLRDRTMEGACLGLKHFISSRLLFVIVAFMTINHLESCNRPQATALVATYLPTAQPELAPDPTTPPGRPRVWHHATDAKVGGGVHHTYPYSILPISKPMRTALGIITQITCC